MWKAANEPHERLSRPGRARFSLFIARERSEDERPESIGGEKTKAPLQHDNYSSSEMKREGQWKLESESKHEGRYRAIRSNCKPFRKLLRKLMFVDYNVSTFKSTIFVGQ